MSKTQPEKRRLKFLCWKCKRNFSLLLEIKGEPRLTVACPYCATNSIADLAPYRKQVTEVMRGGEKQETREVWDFPGVIPTTES